MIAAIDRKMFRDLALIRGQAIAIGAVVASGIAVYVAWTTTSISMRKGLDSYYEEQRFAHVFTSLNRAPLALSERVRDIPGVAAVDARIVESVSLDIPDLDEPAVGRLISLPDRGEPNLNGVFLIEGRFPDPNQSGEVVAQDTFVEANGYKPGDSIRALMNGRMQTLRIVGVGMTPEYLTTVPPGTAFPDSKRFGIFWMRRQQMETAFDMEGGFNDLTLSLLPGVSAEPVILRLDRLLDKYGNLGAYARERQLSHRFITDELAQLKVMTMIPPSIFLGVAAFLLNVVIRRILSMQRSQIAALKAFGYTSFQVAVHYGKLVGLIVIGGAIVGCFAGTFLGQNITELYGSIYRFPTTVFQPAPQAYLVGVFLSWISGLVGVTGAVRQAVNIQPAEAMRPEAPPVYRQSYVERLGWNRWMAKSTQMIFRELGRRPIKAMLTSLGIAFACAVLVVGNFGKDAIDFIIDLEFGLQSRQDATVNFNDAVPARVVTSLKSIQGIEMVETFRAVPVRLRHGQYHRQLSILGLEEHRDLFRLLDEDEQVIEIPPDGLVLSAHIADILDLSVGERVTIEVLEKDRPVRLATVVSRVKDFTGSSAYMQMDALNKLMREPPSISGAFVRMDPKWAEPAYRQLKNSPAVAGVSVQKAAYQGFMETFAENLLRFRVINIMFASVIAIGVVYNSARVTLSERSRELATLRVIGFTRGEVSAILLGELALLTIIAIPVGWGIGYALCWSIVSSLPTEEIRIPMVLSPGTYGTAALVITVASVISGMVVRRGIDRLDLVSVLKANE